MSMISEQVADLREKAQIFEDSGCATNGIVKTFREAADTIEELSAKLATANMERSTAYYNDGWIPCSERLPDDSGKWCYSMNLVTIENGDVCLGVYCEEEGKWRTRMSEGETVYTTQHEVLAWMPLPEPYKGVE